MELRAEKHPRKGYDRYNVIVVGHYTHEEQQVLSQKNKWTSHAVTFTTSRGFFDSEQFSANYYEFVAPGLLIKNFSRTYADSFIRQCHGPIAAVINRALAALIRGYQLAQRDAFFNGGMIIDMNPNQGPVPLPILPAVPPAPRGLPPIAGLSLDGVPTKNHSRINLADLVREKIAPTPPASIPEVEHLTWHFDEPEDEQDHTVRLYAVLSVEERALIKRFGLHHHSFGQVQVFDEDALEQLQHTQEQELAATIDPATRASLRIEHKEQLQYAREAKEDLTLLSFFSYPFVKTFANRYQATAGQRKMQGTMMEIKKLLEQHHDK